MSAEKGYKNIIENLQTKLANSHKMLDVIWNNAIKASMDQFGVEHKPRCVRIPCASCHARELLTPLLRDENLNRKTPKEIVLEYVESSKNTPKYIGKEKKAYQQGINDILEELIKKGIV